VNSGRTGWIGWRALVLMATLQGMALAAPLNSPVLGGQQMREDLVYLRDVWAPKDKSFDRKQRTRFEDIINAAIARASELTPVEFSLEISRAVAVSGNGHTSAELGTYFHGLPFYIKSDLIGAPAPSGVHDPFDDILNPQPRCVVIDLRFNSGGDFTKTILFSLALPRVLPNAKIFVLVGPGTFSAALVTAAMLKGRGGSQVVLVGETMGDRPRFWAEGFQTPLPNSRILVRYASGYQDWGNGCDDVSRCIWLNVALAEKNVSLEPEIRVATTFSDYVTGRDSVLEAALRAAPDYCRDSGAGFLTWRQVPGNDLLTSGTHHK
jgi:hypothetical protein